LDIAGILPEKVVAAPASVRRLSFDDSCAHVAATLPCEQRRYCISVTVL